MSKLLTIMIACVFLGYGFAQQTNLVPNSGFEQGTYNGGTNPTNYYSGVPANTGQQRFESDISNWKVANPSGVLVTADSPDWIPSNVLDADGFCGYHTSYYVRSASRRESIVTELVGGYHLNKGQTYRFRIKVRAARAYSSGPGSFQLVFSTNSDGLDVANDNKWVAGDFYMNQSCDWRYIDYYFVVPNDNSKNFDQMKYIVLQYNNESNESNNPGGSASLILHYDDVYLTEATSPCEEVKYIQDWKYFDENKIVQANQAIYAGAHVSPNAWEANNPVIVTSTAKVIYRAPVVSLEPGFFVEEPGSYFETQVGSCVANPCPTIPTFAGPTGTLCGPVILGESLPQPEPGVFYSWEPSQYFSDPWSRVTTFTPPSNAQSGCIDAKLVIWTICGAAQTYNFPVKYFNQAPGVTLTNVQDSPTSISATANITNASSYTVQLINTATGQVISEQTAQLSCGNFSVQRAINFAMCNGNDMCGNRTIKVIVHNDCFPDAQASATHTGVTIPNPVVSVTNLSSTNFLYAFNVAMNSYTEYVTVDVLDAVTLQPAGCSKTYNVCSQGAASSFSWNSNMCAVPGSCLSNCKDYKIRIRIKNLCNATVTEQTLLWDKTGTSQINVANYPNVITPNGDGINDQLCFNVTGADSYSFVVVNRWGNTMLESSGCANANPLCVWAPTGISDDVYFYTITFNNSCGGATVSNTQSITVLSALAQQNDPGQQITGALISSGNEGGVAESVDGKTPIASNKTADLENVRGQDLPQVYLFPNPADDKLYVRSVSEITKVIVRDLNGKVVYSADSVDFIDCSEFASGAYFVEVTTPERVLLNKFFKK